MDFGPSDTEGKAWGGAVLSAYFHHVLPGVVERSAKEGSESKCRKMTHAIQTVWMLVDSGASGGSVCGGDKKECGVHTKGN